MGTACPGHGLHSAGQDTQGRGPEQALAEGVNLDHSVNRLSAFYVLPGHGVQQWIKLKNPMPSRSLEPCGGCGGGQR